MDFAGETISLGNDIVLNEEGETANGWITTIGSSSRPFAGVFDGNGHTIRGLYINSGKDQRGLFGNVSGTIRNLRLEGGSITTSGVKCGSVAGVAAGTIEGVYSNVQIVKTGYSGADSIGGIVGYTDGSLTVRSCWFDGSIQSAGRGNGGIIGAVKNTTDVHVEHCLYSGSIAAGAAASRTGGICGVIHSAGVSIEDTFSNGSYTFTVNQYQSGTIIGIVDPNSDDSGTEVTVSHVFQTRSGTLASAGISLNGAEPYAEYEKVRGKIHGAVKNDRFVGYFSDYSAYLNGTTMDASLNPDYWALSKSGTPVLRSLADAGDVYNVTDANTAMCLTYWSNPIVLIDRAVDCGGGNYRLTISDTAAGSKTYSGYVEALKSAGFVCVENTIGGRIYNATCSKGEWRVTVIHVGGSVNTTYIIFNTDQPVSPNLLPTAADNTAVKEQNKLHMLDLIKSDNENTLDSANCMVVELKNGHYIVYDGGPREEHLGQLMTYLKGLAGGNEVVIDAWVISHGHSDHVGALGVIRNYDTSAAIREYLSGVKVEGIYVNEPNDAVNAMEAWVGTSTQLNYLRRAVPYLQTTTGDAPNVYRLEAGQTYYFGDITLDVVFSQDLFTCYEDFVCSNLPNGSANIQEGYYADFNETSTWVKLNINGKSVMLSGDGNVSSMEYMMRAYAYGYLSADVFQVPHHGLNTYNNYSIYCSRPAYVLLECHYDVTSYTSWREVTSGSNNTGNNLILVETINANRFLLGRSKQFNTNAEVWSAKYGNDKYDLSVYDTGEVSKLFYMNGFHTVLAFADSGIIALQAAK